MTHYKKPGIHLTKNQQIWVSKKIFKGYRDNKFQ